MSYLIKYCFVFVVSLLIVSCKNKHTNNFSETPTGLHYKLNVIGEGNKSPKFGDYLLLNIQTSTLKDSILSDSVSIFLFTKPSYQGSFKEGILKMKEGDVMTFIQNINTFYLKELHLPPPTLFKNNDSIKLQIELIRILNKNELSTERQKIIDDRDITEQKQLTKYLKQCKVDFKPLKKGIYYYTITPSTGVKAEMGKYVTINYRGSFLNGKEFDSNYNTYALDFTLGDQYQVIKGLEIGISFMKQGEKTKFIIPSHLAYGEKGSSTGAVPPYSTVIYEVELLTVK